MFIVGYVLCFQTLVMFAEIEFGTNCNPSECTYFENIMVYFVYFFQVHTWTRGNPL